MRSERELRKKSFYRLTRALGVGLLCMGVVAGGRAMGQAQPTLSVPVTPPAATGYTVTGRVLCGDTQRPARFADVTLVPAATAQGQGGFGRGRRLSGPTDLDGNFAIANVEPGDYFVVARMTGYVNQMMAVENALNASGDVGAAAPGVPQVHVGAGGASTQLLLQRGGVIGGMVTWDDGSPAAGVQVDAQPAPTTGAMSTSASQLPGPGQGRTGMLLGFGGFGATSTDDRGRFRLSGLAAGTYVVRASVQAAVPQRSGDTGFVRSLNLAVYAPDKMRRSDATAITVAGGEERDDVAITLGLAGLHSVSGTVSSSNVPVRSGTVTLTDQADSSLNRRGAILADGSFSVPYVPPGNYTLRVNASANALAGGGRGGGAVSSTGSGVRFESLQESVTVVDSDLTGLTLNVSAATSGSE